MDKVVPTGILRHLSVSEINPSHNNPRVLFDPGPLANLEPIFGNMAFWFR